MARILHWSTRVTPVEMSPARVRLLRQEMLHDFPGGSGPDTGMRADVFERGIQRADPMRLASDKRVDRDSHDAGDCLTLTVERVELTAKHRLEFGTDTFISK